MLASAYTHVHMCTNTRAHTHRGDKRGRERGKRGELGISSG